MKKPIDMDYKRIVLIVLDSVGIGEAPDATAYGDAGADTLGHIAEQCGLPLKNLAALGLGKIRPLKGMPEVDVVGVYGKAQELSNGKDTITGHWEIAGLTLEQGFPTYWEGFPADLIADFEQKTGRKVLGNKPASGMDIIREYGQKHLETGDLIVYTSADSVFQIAAHEEKIPLPQLYRYCEIAREMTDVGRVIARPFLGTNAEDFYRTSHRKDYAVLPAQTMLDRLQKRGKKVYTLGKISDIFCGQGIYFSQKTKNNADGLEKTIACLQEDFEGLLFVNLIDFDMEYGHRRDVEGYQKALIAFDDFLPTIQKNMKNEDLLIITADHGNDPTFKGNDHTREYVPILAWSQGIFTADLGIQKGFFTLAATIEELLLGDKKTGSFADLLKK